MLKWFYNLKIATKIVSGFAFGAVVLGVVGLMGIVNIDSTSKQNDELYKEFTENMGEISEVQNVVQQISLDTALLIATDDAINIKTYSGDIFEQRAKVETLISEFKKDIDDNEIQLLYNDLIATNTESEKNFDQVISLATENKDEEAFSMISEKGALGIAIMNEEEVIKKIIDREVIVGEIKKDASKDKTEETIILMTSVGAIMLIVALSFGVFISLAITRPLKKAIQMIKEMSKGHLSERLNLDTKDEIGEMATVLDHFAEDLQNTVIRTMNQISIGDLSANLENRDDRDEIGPAMRNTIENIKNLIVEVDMLSQAAINGQLDKRGNTKDFEGGFREVIEGVNGTIDALVEPLKVSGNYLDRIGKGEIPEKFNRSVSGDYVEIKNSINACIDGLGGIEEGNRILHQMSFNDYTQKMEGHYLGIFGEMAESINNLHFNISYVIQFNNDMANGDMSNHLEVFKKSGKLSENDEFIPSLIKLVENIGMLVEETRQMSRAAIKGDLDNRGDSTKFNGEYVKIIEGFNDTLEAITAPMLEASVVLNELSQGNLNTLMKGDYEGQNGKIKNDMNQTVRFLKGYVAEITETLKQISNKNLNIEIKKNYLGEFQEIKTALNNITISLSDTMADINTAAEQVDVGARQISDGGQALAQGTTEQASSIQELTASIEEVSNKTKKNAKNADKANKLTGKVQANAEAGDSQMNKMVTSMSDINESSNNISKIIKVIDDIAFQTNILALNAAVEAARAGQQGKGFAVVAEEVRTLAARSAEAAKETTNLIEGSIKKVEIGTQIADDTAEGLKVILENIWEVKDIIGLIAESSNEQAFEIAQITRGIEEVSKVIQTNSATAEESAAASEELSGQAEMLKGLVNEFIVMKKQ